MKPVISNHLKRTIWLVLAIGFNFFHYAYAIPGLDSPSPIAAYLNGAFPDTSPGTIEGNYTQVATDDIPF